MNETAQEGAARQHNRATRNPATVLHDNGCDAIIVHLNIESIAFNNRQIFNRIDLTLHGFAVEPPVGLSARTTDGRSLFAIEHAELDSRCVGNPTHQTIQRIDLANEVSLAQTADGRIAGHDANRLTLMGNKGGFCTMPCSGSSGFAARVATANNNDIE
ncbi:hypothetical protein L905_04285 [Agrobacterium sp. TS43]|nr:hypothetical protein L904_11160 [Agrobacterium sp. LY4]KVK43020.1 hypothetical protein L903_11180 [Agrobacterium sp. JL28]KVK57267.1 hypothetical protein L906_11145 [Agrobacterium sp. TS45]KVK60045.1 hypothetical protein L907_11125 [Agrobacterium sp. C13]KVK67297.1 hypothetical protein L905_04285 [Agrobacterium sp. TS43]